MFLIIISLVNHAFFIDKKLMKAVVFLVNRKELQNNFMQVAGVKEEAFFIFITEA